MPSPTCALTVHPGPHVFNGQDFFPKLRAALGENRQPPLRTTRPRWPGVRFMDGPESLDGTPYHWLGRTEPAPDLRCAPAAGRRAGTGLGRQSRTERDAVLPGQRQSVPVRDGGHWGFRWIRVPIAGGADRASVTRSNSDRGQGQPAFLSEVRLTSPGRRLSRPA